MLARNAILVVDFGTRGVRQSKQNRLVKAVCFALHEDHNQEGAQWSVGMPSLPSLFVSFP